MSGGALVHEYHEYIVNIREVHLDTFGHVNNAIYLQLFEEARWEIITQRGYGLDKILETKVGPTLLGVTLQFRREISNREVIKIRSWVSKQEGKVTTLRQVMVNAKGEEACVADFLIGLFDLQTRRLIPPTPEWAQAIGL